MSRRGDSEFNGWFIMISSTLMVLVFIIGGAFAPEGEPLPIQWLGQELKPMVEPIVSAFLPNRDSFWDYVKHIPLSVYKLFVGVLLFCVIGVPVIIWIAVGIFTLVYFALIAPLQYILKWLRGDGWASVGAVFLLVALFGVWFFVLYAVGIIPHSALGLSVFSFSALMVIGGVIFVRDGKKKVRPLERIKEALAKIKLWFRKPDETRGRAALRILKDIILCAALSFVLAIPLIVIGAAVCIFKIASFLVMCLVAPIWEIHDIIKDRKTRSAGVALMFLLVGAWSLVFVSFGVYAHASRKDSVQTDKPSYSVSETQTSSSVANDVRLPWENGNSYNQGSHSEETRANPVYSITYIGNKNTKVYHRQGCRYLPDAKKNT